MTEDEIVEVMMKGGWPEYYHDNIAKDAAENRLRKALAALRAKGLVVVPMEDLQYLSRYFRDMVRTASQWETENEKTPPVS